MSTAELKLNLIDKLLSETNNELLLSIEKLFNTSNKNQVSDWKSLSKNQQDGIIDAINELQNNEGINHKNIIEKYTKKYAKTC